MVSISSSMATVSLKGDSVNATAGSVVIVPFRVFDFNAIIGFQGTFNFDTTYLSFSGIQSFANLPSTFNSGNFFTQGALNGQITYLWTDLSLGGVGLADSSILFSLVFNLKGPIGVVTPISFVNAPTALEIVDTSFVSIPNVVYQPGKVKIQSSTAYSIQAPLISNLNYCQNESFSLTYSVTGNFNSSNQFNLELSDDAGSFSTPTVIGSTIATGSGVIQATIPLLQMPGNAYKLRITSSNPALVSAVNNGNINVFAKPSVTLAQFAAVCISDAEFTLTGGSPSGGVYSGNGVDLNGQKFNPLLAGLGAHVITYTYTNANNCVNSNTQNITVSRVPTTPTISQTGNLLTSSYVNGNQWLLNSAPIIGANAQTYTMVQSGLYSLVVSEGGCLSDTAKGVSFVGVEEVYNAGFKLYPNPAKQNVVITLDNPSLIFDLEITNALGQIQKVTSTATPLGLNIDLQELKAGAYFVRLKSPKVMYTKKLMVTK